MRNPLNPLLLRSLKLNRSLQIILLNLQIEQFLPIRLLNKHFLLINHSPRLPLLFLIQHLILHIQLFSKLIRPLNKILFQMSQLPFLLNL